MKAKKIMTGVFVAAALSVMASCTKNNTPTVPTQARVMFMNTNLGAAGLDVAANNSKVSGATNLQFLQNTGYLNVTATSAVNLSFLLSSTQSLFIDSSLNLTPGNSYSVFAANYVNAPAIVVTTDSLSAPSSGMAKVRFINLSPDTLKENVNVGSQLVASGIMFKQASSFTQISAGTYKVVAADPNNLGAVQTIASQPFDAGKIYTIVMSGTANGTGALALSLKVVANN